MTQMTQMTQGSISFTRKPGGSNCVSVQIGKMKASCLITIRAEQP